jgi:uncharacterized metal-binding protein YceD (DUF177 family)
VNRSAPEFSRLVSLARVGPQPFRQRIEATSQERENLSRRFDLLALYGLVAEIELRRQSREVILLEAAFEAEFDQCCAVTLDPVRGAISRHFSLVYGPAGEDALEISLSGEEPALEPLIGDAIDIGEAVAQELSLSLPDFPRHPDAMIEGVDPAEPVATPFASLAQLQKRPE